jgi:hypothetical protein
MAKKGPYQRAGFLPKEEAYPRNGRSAIGRRSGRRKRPGSPLATGNEPS